MAERLHALQGRQHTTCPDCGHALHLHTEGRCATCADWAYFDGIESIRADRRAAGFRRACCSSEDEGPAAMIHIAGRGR